MTEMHILHGLRAVSSLVGMASGPILELWLQGTCQVCLSAWNSGYGSIHNKKTVAVRR
jgi:hypothetical protein